MHVEVLEGRHPPVFDVLAAQGLVDLHHEAEVLTAFESHWFSITVSDGPRVLHNSVAPRRIGASASFDVEPFVGYAGLTATTGDPAFIREALRAYSEACRALGIVAELVRFSPFLDNAALFVDRSPVACVHRKAVVVVPCLSDPDAQIASFSPACRRRLAKGLSDLTCRTLDKPAGVEIFRTLYERSMMRVGADDRWYFPDRFYSHVCESRFFDLLSVWAGNTLVAGCLAGFHPAGAHYVLAANHDQVPPGAGERLIFELTREAVRRGLSRLMLGGGLTSAPADSLLRFKRRFTSQPSSFVLGGLVHDRPAFDHLTADALGRRPELSEGAFFLKYRL